MSIQTTKRALMFLMLVSMGISAPLWPDDRQPQIPFADARMIIEFNSTDKDVGIQVFLDGEPWKKVSIFNPNGNRILDVLAKGRLNSLGLTELFFESNEPGLDEMPLEEFLSLFPAGEYRFTGTTIEGEPLDATATFTHNIPNGPSIVAPKRQEVVSKNKAIIQWNPVTAPTGIQISGYEVIVEGGDPERVLDVHLPPTATRFKIPPEFLEPGTDYKFEILAKEVGGNQTISQRSFSTQ